MADWYATEDETAAGMVDLYRRVQIFADADILREQIDGSVGLLPGHSNVPDATDWATYTQRLTAIADLYPARA